MQFNETVKSILEAKEAPNESDKDHGGIYYAHLCGILESKLEDMADILIENELIEGVTGRLAKSLCSRHIEDAKQKSKEYSTQ